KSNMTKKDHEMLTKSGNKSKATTIKTTQDNDSLINIKSLFKTIFKKSTRKFKDVSIQYEIIPTHPDKLGITENITFNLEEVKDVIKRKIHKFLLMHQNIKFDVGIDS